jgi:protein-disulfide isomerase-like protein with CxxC motif
MAEDLILLEKPEWLEKFRNQVYKDYELAGALSSLPVLETSTLPELQQAFYQSVKDLEAKHILANVLYRIDLTEKQIADAVRKQQNIPLPLVLAELMIKRILQKVVLKEMYK